MLRIASQTMLSTPQPKVVRFTVEPMTASLKSSWSIAYHRWPTLMRRSLDGKVVDQKRFRAGIACTQLLPISVSPADIDQPLLVHTCPNSTNQNPIGSTGGACEHRLDRLVSQLLCGLEKPLNVRRASVAPAPTCVLHIIHFSRETRISIVTLYRL